MMNPLHVLTHVTLGRLLLASLLLAPPAGCSPPADDGEQTPVSTSAQRGPVELTITVADDHGPVGTPVSIEIQAQVEKGATIIEPMLVIDESNELGAFNVIENVARPDHPGADGRRIWTQSLVLDTFKPGEHELPQLQVRFEDRRGDVLVEGIVESSALPITISSELGDQPSTATLRDIRGPIDLPLVNWIAWTLVGTSILLAVAWIFFIVRRNIASRHDAPPLPAHELARRELDALEAEGLLERNAFQPFYFRLTDILRHYIEGRFGLLAPTRTTNEFLTDMGTNSVLETDQQNSLSRFLRFSDLVKFALHEPPVEDGRQALVMARTFVQETEPKPDADQVEGDE